MNSRKLVTAALLVVVAAWIAFQNLGSAAPPMGSAASQDAGAAAGPPGPGPEHKLLAKYAGTWDCDVEMNFDPAAPPEKSKGTSTVKVACGGLWIISDFEATMMGGPFTGHGVTGFDPATKKYVLSWADSWTPSLALGEGTYDEKTRTMTTQVKGRDMTGKDVSWRQLEVWKDDDTYDWTMFMPGPDGKEVVGMHIVYRRKQ
jgi:hypothetical protein